MKATRKQMIFLGGFMLLVVGFFGTYVYRALAPKGGAARAAEALRPARAERDSGEAKAEEKEGTVSAGEGFSFLASPAAATEYAVIAERKLFEPLIKPQPQPKSPPPSTPPEKIEPAKPVPLPQEETPPAPPSSPNPKVTVTGFLRLPTGGRVIVENLETKETQIVAPGEEAFGYTVAHLDPGRRMALLMRGEERFPVRWGEGKQEVKVAAKPREKEKEEGRGGEQRREEGEERRPGGPPPPPRPASSFQ
ncbi:MAG TPA: hypothetical protein EYP85_10890, partial [Armatimonadetes bacterium]|nr:hypothetical protein [Armatimonadota bacterium]